VTTKKPATRQRRKRDSHVKTKPAKHAAEVFIDHMATHSGKGVVSDAAQAAYPNQSRNAAKVTGSRLLSDPNVCQQIENRRKALAEAAGLTRSMTLNLLSQIATASLSDFQDEHGQFNWQTARERGIDHLVHEEDITERSSKDGSRRVTRKYKIPDKIRALDLYTEIQGWKKEPAKNPLDAARETYLIMRQDERYKDVSDEELANFPAQRFGVTAAEILEGQSS
jgi:phage terminase small subunit